MIWALQREFDVLDPLLELCLEGDPKSKARPRLGKGGRTYTPADTEAAEALVAARVRNALRGRRPDPAPASFGVMAVFFQQGRQRRDVDNMLKLVMDAVTLSANRYGIGLWVDDSQVSEISARLVRASDHPRTHLRIYSTLTEAAPTADCEYCGTSFRTYPSQPGRYCSRRCAGLASRVRQVGSCRACGKEISSTPSQPKVYCNQDCRRADPSPRVRGPK